MRARDVAFAIGLGLLGAWLLTGPAHQVILRAAIIEPRRTIADFIAPGQTSSAAAARRLARKCSNEACSP